jgi:predicted metal-dependent phosphoesterase TrpH
MIDLHTHSTRSDGSLTPSELMDLAADCGLAAIALTDHDTLSGLQEAETRAKELSLRFIPGVEIEIEAAQGEFHLLGLGLNGRRESLATSLKEIRKGRRERNARIVEKLSAAGYEVSMADVEALAAGDIVSRAHFARLLVSKGIASSVTKAFSHFLGKGRPFYEPRRCLALKEAVELIRGAGGISVIAHPLSLGLRGPALRTFLGNCRDMGVSGLEAYHPNNTPRDCRKLERLGRQAGFVITGGSDFHGAHIPERRLGHAAGGMVIPDAYLDAMP